MSLTQLLFSFRGRISRQPYWLFTLVLVVVVVATLVVADVYRIDRDSRDTYLDALVLASLWPILAVQVKRWHDRNKSGWWVLINLIPVIGGVWSLVENGFLKGTGGPNRYGPNPLQTASEA